MAERVKEKKKVVVSRKRKSNPVSKLWRETIGELRKVSWPTPQEALRLTRIVIIVMVIMSILLGIFDFIFAQMITLLYA
jgi:preprotein translocase subunit SecE